MYKETTAVVIIEGEKSEQFGVGVGLRQGSALSPLLFIMVMNLISGKVSKQEEIKKILYADDVAMVANNKDDLQKALQEWNDTFRKHGLRCESGEDRSNVDRRGTSMYIRFGNTGTDRETGGEYTYGRKQLGPKYKQIN